MTLMKSRRRIVDLAFDTAITAGIRARQNSFGGLFAQQQLRAGNIRFTPKSRHSLRQLECPPWADAVEKVGFSVGVMPLGSSDPAEMSRLLGVEAV
jgi:hypothetical protein